MPFPDHVVLLEILEGQADELLAELRVPQLPGILAGHLLDVEALDRSLEVEDQEDLDAAELALLVDPVDVADLLLVR